jgi:predicted nuclease of predicted toxin-antitoxin system
MKVLLDECLPQKLRHLLEGHDVQSARFAGFSGKKNGELLRLAEDAGFEVLVTADQGIPFQNSLDGRRIALLILKAPSNDIDT